MNAIMCSEAEARQLTDEALVTRFESVAGQNNESDCRDALAVLRAELLRRLRRRLAATYGANGSVGGQGRVR